MAYPANLAVSNWGSLQSGNTADLDTNLRNLQVALNGIGNGASVLSTVAISVASIGQANVGGVNANSAVFQSATINSLVVQTPLPIGSGGSNQSTFANASVVVITAGSMTGILPAANGTVLTSNGTAWGPAPITQNSGFPASSPLSNSLNANVFLANTSFYFDGPSVSQGNTGVWFASGTITVTSGSADGIVAKLWDGSTVISSCEITTDIINGISVMPLSGFITNPVGNIKISAKNVSSTAGFMSFNSSGNSKDCTLTVFRIG